MADDDDVVSEPNPKLAHSPINEVVFETRIQSRESYSKILPRLCNQLADTYPDLITLPAAAFPVDQAGFPNPAHHRFVATGEKYLVQTSPKLFSVNGMAPYLGWEAFSTEARRISGVVAEVAGIEKVERRGLRYVNWLRVTSKDVALDSVLRIPKPQLGLGGESLDTQLRSTIQLSDGLAVTVNVRSPMVDSSVGNYILLDFDCYQESPNDDLGDWLERAHNEAYGVFKKLLTIEAYTRYDSGKETAA